MQRSVYSAGVKERKVLFKLIISLSFSVSHIHATLADVTFLIIEATFLTVSVRLGTDTLKRAQMLCVIGAVNYGYCSSQTCFRRFGVSRGCLNCTHR